MIDQLLNWIQNNQCASIGTSAFMTGLVLQSQWDVLSLVKSFFISGHGDKIAALAARLEAIEAAATKQPDAPKP